MGGEQPGLYMKSEKEKIIFTPKMPLSNTAPGSVPQSAVKQKRHVDGSTPGDRSLCSSAWECHTGLGICVRRCKSGHLSNVNQG